MTAIAYVTTVDTMYRTCTWHGAKQDAINAGVDALNGEDTAAGVVYYDDAAGADYMVDHDDVARLGAALLDGCSMADTHSVWCSSATAWEVEDD